jgi:hypothetical protein
MTSIYAQKITVGHPVVDTMNNSTALIGVVKGGQLGLKGRPIPHIGTAALLQKGETTPDCTLGTCNPVNFTIFNLNETGLEVGKKFGILIYEKETDPGTLLHFQLIVITHESSSYQVFHSFYKEIQSEFPISVKTKNLFLSLAESIAQTLNVTLCYVCGRTNMGDHWPWEAKELKPHESFNETTLPSLRESIWLLKTSIIGNYCISRPKGQFSTPVGDLICLGQKFYNDATQETQWWGGSQSHGPQPHPLANFLSLQ